MLRCAVPTTVLALTALAPTQTTIVLPEGYDRISSDLASEKLWGCGSSGTRVQIIQAIETFVRAGVRGEVVVERLRWRAAYGETTPGGTYGSVTIRMGDAKHPWDSTMLSSTFADNFDPSATIVYAGPVTVQTPSGAMPNDWYVDIPLTTPFTFDASGTKDLIVDVQIQSGNWSGGSSAPLTEWVYFNYNLMHPLCRRIAGFSGSSTTGTISGSNFPVELTLARRADQAIQRPFGRPCHGPQQVDEPFAFGQFDLAGSTATPRVIRVEPTSVYGGGYAVTDGASAWFTPVSVGQALGDEGRIEPTLPFGFPLGGTSYTEADVFANGYLEFEAYQGSNSRPERRFLTNGRPILAPFWTDLELLPAGAGLLHYDVDPGGMAVYFTWLGARDWEEPSTSYDLQLALFSDGSFEFRYGAMSANSFPALVGWPGPAGAPASLPTDLSAELPLYTGGAAAALAVTSNTPDVVSEPNLDVQVSGIPAGSAAGTYLLGTVILPAPFPLDGIGGLGCELWVVPNIGAVTRAWSGSSDVLSVTMPTDPAWIGRTVGAQVIGGAPGANPLNAVLSNGHTMTFGNN